MKDHEIDRILAEDEILPSSGFTASVMDTVRREASETRGIPFPWKPALPGLLLCGSICAVTFILGLSDPPRLADRTLPVTHWLIEIGNSAVAVFGGTEWRPIWLALLVTVFSLVVPLRIGLRRG
jgi:hypothetical protein